MHAADVLNNNIPSQHEVRLMLLRAMTGANFEVAPWIVVDTLVAVVTARQFVYILQYLVRTWYPFFLDGVSQRAVSRCHHIFQRDRHDLPHALKQCQCIVQQSPP